MSLLLAGLFITILFQETSLNNMEKTDIHDLTDIELLVNKFYEKIREDTLLAPVFNERIANWQAHLTVMYGFWHAVLLGDQSYRGNPFLKHMHLNIDAVHFERWLDLFCNTVDEHFVGIVANLAKERAASIAKVFYTKIRHIRSG